MKQQQQTSSSSSTFQTASKGFSYLLSFQLVSKLFTFVANAYLIRNLNVETKGLVFPLELYVLSMLYLSREPFRRACLRVQLNHDSFNNYRLNLSKIVNIAWLSIPYGIIICIGGYKWFDRYFSINDKLNPVMLSNFHHALFLYFISCLIGLLGEPFYIAAQNLLLFSVRFRIEGVALILRVLINLLLVVTWYKDDGITGNVLIAFGISQIVYQAYITIGYIIHFYSHSKALYRMENGILDLLPIINNTIDDANDDENDFKTLLWLTGGFSLQTIVKFVLTDGEKYVLMIYQSLSDQGVYDIVSQLGSLAARLIFQPIEENAFTIWSKSLKVTQQQQQQHDSDVRNSAIMLQILVKLFIIVGCCFVFFGPSYSFTLFYILYGKIWAEQTEAPRVLSFYCLYVMMMALNGTTEGFVHAASTPKQTQLFNLLMIVFSCAYLGTAIFCLTVLQLGTVSLIIANCINMALRVIFSTVFITRYFSDTLQNTSIVFRIRNCIPHLFVWIVFSMSLFITKMSESHLESRGFALRVVHIGIGAVCLLITAIVIRWKERDFVQKVIKLLTGKLHTD
jgi:oligosaccharide translocation protein RFT1